MIAAVVETHLRWRHVGLVGLNPAIAEALARRRRPERLRITDLDPDNIGATRVGLPIRDGGTRSRELIIGVTCAALAHLFGFQRFCPYARG